MGEIGRPRKSLDLDLILDLTREGYAVRSICKLVGISERTFYDRKSKDDDFSQAWNEAHEHAIRQMRFEAEECVLSAIRKGSEKSAQWFLSHKHPAEYAERRIQTNDKETASPFDRLAEAIAKRMEKHENDTSVTDTD